MTAYFDEKQSEVREVGVENPPRFLEDLARIEGEVLRDVSLCCGDREFPGEFREKIMGICATRSVVEFGVTGAVLTPSKDSLDYARATRCSSLLEELHSAFHALARKRVQTRFGLLSDDPRGNVSRRDDHDSPTTKET